MKNKCSDKTRVYVLRWEEDKRRWQGVFTNPTDYLAKADTLRERKITYTEGTRELTPSLARALEGIREDT